ncbi:MAG: hypothetical protein AAGI90_02635 [Chlamydiota bacterium]
MSVMSLLLTPKHPAIESIFFPLPSFTKIVKGWQPNTEIYKKVFHIVYRALSLILGITLFLTCIWAPIRVSAYINKTLKPAPKNSTDTSPSPRTKMILTDTDTRSLTPKPRVFRRRSPRKKRLIYVDRPSSN